MLDLLERVPVYAVEIPWGISAGDTTIDAVMAAVWAADEPTTDTPPTRTP